LLEGLKEDRSTAMKNLPNRALLFNFQNTMKFQGLSFNKNGRKAEAGAHILMEVLIYNSITWA